MGQYTSTTFIWQELHLELDEQHLICFNLILLQSSKAAESQGQATGPAQQPTQVAAVSVTSAKSHAVGLNVLESMFFVAHGAVH